MQSQSARAQSQPPPALQGIAPGMQLVRCADPAEPRAAPSIARGFIFAIPVAVALWAPIIWMVLKLL